MEILVFFVEESKHKSSKPVKPLDDVFPTVDQQVVPIDDDDDDETEEILNDDQYEEEEEEEEKKEEEEEKQQVFLASYDFRIQQLEDETFVQLQPTLDKSALLLAVLRSDAEVKEMGEEIRQKVLMVLNSTPSATTTTTTRIAIYLTKAQDVLEFVKLPLAVDICKQLDPKEYPTNPWMQALCICAHLQCQATVDFEPSLEVKRAMFRMMPDATIPITLEEALRSPMEPNLVCAAFQRCTSTEQLMDAWKSITQVEELMRILYNSPSAAFVLYSLLGMDMATGKALSNKEMESESSTTVVEKEGIQFYQQEDKKEMEEEEEQTKGREQLLTWKPEWNKQTPRWKPAVFLLPCTKMAQVHPAAVAYLTRLFLSTQPAQEVVHSVLQQLVDWIAVSLHETDIKKLVACVTQIQQLWNWAQDPELQLVSFSQIFTNLTKAAMRMQEIPPNWVYLAFVAQILQCCTKELPFWNWYIIQTQEMSTSATMRENLDSVWTRMWYGEWSDVTQHRYWYGHFVHQMEHHGALRDNLSCFQRYANFRTILCQSSKHWNVLRLFSHLFHNDQSFQAQWNEDQFRWVWYRLQEIPMTHDFVVSELLQAQPVFEHLVEAQLLSRNLVQWNKEARLEVVETSSKDHLRWYNFAGVVFGMGLLIGTPTKYVLSAAHLKQSLEVRLVNDETKPPLPPCQAAFRRGFQLMLHCSGEERRRLLTYCTARELTQMLSVKSILKVPLSQVVAPSFCSQP